MNIKKCNRSIWYILIILLLFPSVAYCYLDPGTGSYLIQILAAVLFGGIFVLKTFWSKIVLFFSKGKRDEDKK